jgi:hypothetical protein
LAERNVAPFQIEEFKTSVNVLPASVIELLGRPENG